MAPNDDNCNEAVMIEQCLLKAIYAMDNNITDIRMISNDFERPKAISRSSTCAKRGCDVDNMGLESHMHCLCDTLCFMQSKTSTLTEEAWVQNINEILPDNIRVYSLIKLPPGSSDYNADKSCTQRLYEIMLPFEYLLPSQTNNTEPLWADSYHSSTITDNDSNMNNTHQRPAANTNRRQYIRREDIQLMDRHFPSHTRDGQLRLAFFRRLKAIFKLFVGKHAMHNYANDGASPDEAAMNRRIDRFYHKEIIYTKPLQLTPMIDHQNEKLSAIAQRNHISPLHKNSDTPSSFHHDPFLHPYLDINPFLNSPSALKYDHAHPSKNPDQDNLWVVLSMSGDMFLHGQVRHMIGMLVAVCRKLLPIEYVLESFHKDHVTQVLIVVRPKHFCCSGAVVDVLMTIFTAIFYVLGNILVMINCYECHG
jgi:tRNA U38,U39,U40 pseudouridine synthase TruA